jgi:hypothetical protein
MISGDSRKSYTKALVLLIAIVAVLFIGTVVLKIISSPTRSVHAIFGAEALTGIQYRDNQKDSVQQKIAGFWFCDNAVDSGTLFIRSSDRMELKPNGIYWRVKSVGIMLPSGDSAQYLVASTGFACPYSHAGSSPDSLTCQVHYIGTTVVSAGDTCYLEISRPDPSASMLPQLQALPKAGEGTVDTVWSLIAGDGRLSFGDRRYSRYDTAGQALYRFYPKGSIESVNKFSLNKCGNALSLELFVKRMLAKDFAGLAVPERTGEDILAAVRRYYERLFAQNLARRVTVYGKGRAHISFSVNGEGRVAEPIHVSSRPWNMKLDAELKREVQTWVFPRCSAQKEPVNVKFEMSY